MSETLHPARAVLPGEVIETELAARGWAQRDLAEIMGRPPQVISEIIRGIKQITPETAIELAQAFGTSAELWIRLETSYRLHQARRRQDADTGIVARSTLYNLLPIAELLRRGWITSGQAGTHLEQAVQDFLGGNPTQVVSAVSLRHAQARGPAHGAQVAWVQRIRHLAARQAVPQFERARLVQMIPQLLQLALRPEQVGEVPGLIQSLGIRFVIVPQLLGTFIDGALCEPQGSPIVALTLRYDRIDAFWFTLMHELAHLVLGHRTLHLDLLDDDEQLRDAQEIAANAQACAWLIDRAELDEWVARTRPYFARRAIEQFAATQQVHPGIILGQLMFDKTVEYRHLRGLLAKVSPHLAAWIDAPIPSALRRSP